MHEIFYFKQKTAYEMRISDWSSDVCSSDLLAQYVERAIGAAAAIGADPLAHVVAGDLDHSALDIAQRCNAGRRYRFSFAETAPKGNPPEGNHPERRQRLAADAATAQYAQHPGDRTNVVKGQSVAITDSPR